MSKKKGKYHINYDWFYQTAEWKALRSARFTEANGLCERCRRRGIIAAGKEVHHIVPIDKDFSRRLDFDNTVLLCSDCHNEQHERISPLQKFNLLWEDLQNGGTPSDDGTEQKLKPK